LFLEDRVVLVRLASTGSRRLLQSLLAAENDLLEQENMVFPIDVGFGYHEDVL
jgi:hypothetical protein